VLDCWNVISWTFLPKTDTLFSRKTFINVVCDFDKRYCNRLLHIYLTSKQLYGSNKKCTLHSICHQNTPHWNENTASWIKICISLKQRNVMLPLKRWFGKFFSEIILVTAMLDTCFKNRYLTMYRKSKSLDHMITGMKVWFFSGRFQFPTKTFVTTSVITML